MKSIQLRGKYGIGLIAFVDEIDYPRVMLHKWYGSTPSRGSSRPYAKFGNNKSIFLSRFIINAPIGWEVDHINRNPLDNRRENLRLATTSENNRNKPQKNNSNGYRGVAFHNEKNRIKKYQARMKVRNKYISLGYFSSAKEAFEVYKDASIKEFGEFAIF